MKHLILEGPDHIGKTTVARWLREHHGYNVMHMGVPTPDWDYEKDYLARLPNNKKIPIVYDRFHLGALVYGRFGRLHSTDGWSWDGMMRVIRAVCRADISVVIMYTSDSNWLGRMLMEHGKKELFNAEQVLAANEVYQMLAYAKMDGTMFCDWTWDVKDGVYPGEKEIEAWITI